jgi:phenylalanyl-tRNA synthetase beta chain
MKFSESWLRTLVNPPLSGEALSHLLTMAGLEVEAQEPVAAMFDQVVVGLVLSKEKHPDADRLNLLSVDVGQGQPLSIVCGAGNVTVGMKAPCALVGAKLPGMEIRQAKVRGVASWGMMCSEKELGLADEASGLMVLPDSAPIGQSIREFLELDDTAITLKLTPNRCDCLSLYGIAREVAALTGEKLQTLPACAINADGQSGVQVTVEAADACPRYTGRIVYGVNARAATPDWMVRRLLRSGLRSISAIVDVSNYVLLELGQPLHAFDLAKLNGGITVRYAQAGEKIALLNGQTIALDPDMLVIADAGGAVALAGIMGGSATAVDEATTDIFLESAFFAPSAITGKSRRLGFGSDSSYRFERGVDFAATQIALDRATELILDICGGQAGGATEVCGKLPARAEVTLRVARVARVLGITLALEEIAQILSRLGMAVRDGGSALFVTPPSYRFDIAIEEDLIEEIARVYGYENIPLPATTARMALLPVTETRRPLANVRQMMVQRDYQETINYAFVEREAEQNLCGNNNPLALQNPIASQMSVMRSSLLGGLLTTLSTNLARRQPRVRVFETGACFVGDLQHERLAGLCYGDAYPEQWGTPARSVDFFDVKADVEALFAPATLRFTAAAHPASHPTRSAQIVMGDQAIGWIGELHPQWVQRYDIPLAPVWFELEMDALLQTRVPRAVAVSKFPPVRRDLAVVVDDGVAVQALLEALNAEHAPYVVAVQLFDLYRGKTGAAGWEAGKKSLAFRVLLQDTEKTLTDAEIEQSMARLTAALQQQGAQLRV